MTKLLLQQIFSSSSSPLEPLFLTPLFDLSMVSRKKNLRDPHFTIDRRPCVPGAIEQRILERIAQRRFPVMQDTRNQPHDSIDDEESRKLASGKHVIADRDFLCDQSLSHPLIDAFVVSTKKEEICAERKTGGHSLVEVLSVR